MHGNIGKLDKNNAVLINIWTLVTRAPLNKCTLKPYYFTFHNGNQDVRVSEKRDIKMLTYHPKLYRLGIVDNRPSTA
jgi:hypothetical protein